MLFGCSVCVLLLLGSSPQVTVFFVLVVLVFAILLLVWIHVLFVIGLICMCFWLLGCCSWVASWCRWCCFRVFGIWLVFWFWFCLVRLCFVYSAFCFGVLCVCGLCFSVSGCVFCWLGCLDSVLVRDLGFVVNFCLLFVLVVSLVW